MKFSPETDGDAKPDWTKLIVDLAVRLYGHHSHAGKSHISMAAALELAATLVGAAQSTKVNEAISRAAADPITALDTLRRKQATAAEAFDVERRRQIDDWAAALNGGAGQ